VGVRAHLGCGRTLAGPAHHRIAPVDSWLGLDLFYIGARPKFGSWMGLCFIPWCMIYFTLFALCLFAWFSTCSNMSPAKHVFSNTSGTRLIVYACVESLLNSPVLDII